MQDNSTKLNKQDDSQAILKACGCGGRPLILCEQKQKMQRCEFSNEMSASLQYLFHCKACGKMSAPKDTEQEARLSWNTM